MAHGIRQELFAKDMGVTFASASRWINGVVLPDRWHMDRIVKYTSGLVCEREIREDYHTVTGNVKELVKATF